MTRAINCELLAPAGNLAKLKLALYYGADAVYLGGKSFSLRTFADNFTEEELAEGISYAHARGAKVYVAANIFARNADLMPLRGYLPKLARMGADAVLVSDAGVFSLCRSLAPELPVHISTQANTANAAAAEFWARLGAKRIVLARELSLREIAEIHAACPQVELEAFVHGAMCISYSGRCYLSDYLEHRPSNRGACAQPCRARYRVQAEGKDGWQDVEEDGKGSYLLNSKDLNMSGALEDLARAGVVSFKIEGRMKGEYYLATVVNAYRRIMRGEDAGGELEKLAHREYTTADEVSGGGAQSPHSSQTSGTHAFLALVKGSGEGRVRAEMRTRFCEGDTAEILSPSQTFGKTFAIRDLRDSAGAPVSDAKLVQAEYSFLCPYPLREGDILRKKL